MHRALEWRQLLPPAPLGLPGRWMRFALLSPARHGTTLCTPASYTSTGEHYDAETGASKISTGRPAGSSASVEHGSPLRRLLPWRCCWCCIRLPRLEPPHAGGEGELGAQPLLQLCHVVSKVR